MIPLQLTALLSEADVAALAAGELRLASVVLRSPASGQIAVHAPIVNNFVEPARQAVSQVASASNKFVRTVSSIASKSTSSTKIAPLMKSFQRLPIGRAGAMGLGAGVAVGVGAYVVPKVRDHLAARRDEKQRLAAEAEVEAQERAAAVASEQRQPYYAALADYIAADRDGTLDEAIVGRLLDVLQSLGGETVSDDEAALWAEKVDHAIEQHVAENGLSADQLAPSGDDRPQGNVIYLKQRLEVQRELLREAA